MSNQYIQDYHMHPLGQSTAPSTSYNNSLWNQSLGNQGMNSASNSQYQQQQTGAYTRASTSDDKLKLQLNLKDNQIESLTNEIKVLNESLSALNKDNNGNNSNKQENIPVSVNAIFIKLNKSRLEILEELKDTKLRLESLVTAYTLNPSNNITENGRYDELEISHKILIKLENLKKENEDLLKSLSFGKMKNMEMNINLIKQENIDLKEENLKLKEKLLKLEEKK